MQYRKYGKDGPEISRLGFGVMRLPAVREGDWGSVDFPRSLALMRAAMRAGVNFFDSHHNYHHGKSEVAIGRALKGWRGQRIYVQTKTPWYKDEPVEYFEKLLDAAMDKLGVDRIDTLLHHSLDWETWRKKGRAFVKFTDRAMKRGLIARRGCSAHDTPANVRRIVDTGEFSVLLVSYNWLNPEMLDVIAHASDRGMGVAIMNPVGGGALATRTPEILRLLPGAKTPAEIAMRYVLATPGVTCALSGMNALPQLKENARVASRRTPLTPAQEARLRDRIAAVRAEATKFCTQCGYCMPCKHGVRIPDNFKLYSQARYFGLVEHARKHYRMLAKHEEGDRSAAACTRCGACEKKCPFNIPIVRQLHDVAKRLG